MAGKTGKRIRKVSMLRSPDDVIDAWREKLRPAIERINQNVAVDCTGRRQPVKRRKARLISR